MNWFICNVCLCRPVNGIKTYHVTSCFHLICERCISPSDTICSKCGQKCAVVPCNSRAPEKVKNLFCDTTKRIILYKRALGFQQVKRTKMLAFQNELSKKYVYIKDLLVANKKNVDIIWHKYQEAKTTIKEKENIISILERKLKAYEEHLAKHQIGPSDYMKHVNNYYLGICNERAKMSEYSHIATPRRVPLGSSSVFISPESINSKASSASSGYGSGGRNSCWGSQSLNPSSNIATPSAFQPISANRRFV